MFVSRIVMRFPVKQTSTTMKTKNTVARTFIIKTCIHHFAWRWALLITPRERKGSHAILFITHKRILRRGTLWYPQWTKYLLTSSTPQLLTSSTPLLSGTPSGQNTSLPPPLLNSTALWYPKWTKYLLTSSPPQLRRSLVPQWTKYLLTSSPPQLRRSLAAQVDKIPPHLLNFATLWHPKWPHHALWRPKWRSLTPLVALSGASRGNLLCSLAPSNGRPPTNHLLLLVLNLCFIFI